MVISLVFEFVNIRRKTKLSRKQWMYGEAALLAAVSGTIVFGDVPNVWVPMPMPNVLVAFITLILFPFVTPVFYVLVLMLSSPSIHFEKIVLFLVVVFGALNIMYFQSAWEYGVRYQGPEHTKIVAVENIVGFGIAVVIAVFSLAKGSSSLAYIANLLYLCCCLGVHFLI